MTKSQLQLLWIAGVLAALQFIVKPILAWQNETITEVSLSQSRIERSEQLLSHQEEIAQAAADAEAFIQELEQKFPQAKESSMLQIELQSSIEERLRSSNVNLQEFAWLTGLEYGETILASLRARVRFSGDLGGLSKAQFQLLQTMPNMIHESIELRRDSRRRGAYVMTIQLRVNVRPGEGA